MDTREVQAPTWYRTDGDDGAQWGGRAWKSRRRDGGDDCQDGNGSAPTEQDPTRTTVVQPRVLDEQMGATGASASAAPQATPPGPQAVEVPLTERQRAVWKQAQFDGVEITAAAIAAMAEEELEEWADANLI